MKTLLSLSFILFTAGLTAVAQTYTATTFADLGPNSNNQPNAVTVDATSGFVFVAIPNLHQVWKLDPAGAVVQRIGSGRQGFDGDNGPASEAALNHPQGVAADRSGNLYIADTGNHRIRKVSAVSGVIGTVAGNGKAADDVLNSPSAIAVDRDGNLYIADAGNHRIRKVQSAGGDLTTIAGSGVYTPKAVAVDASGNVYFSDAASRGVFKWSSTDEFAIGLASDASGDLYIADGADHGIRKISAAKHAVSLVQTERATALAVDENGIVYALESLRPRLRKLTPTIPITIVTAPRGLQFAVRGPAGCEPGTYTAPRTFHWTQGAACTVTAAETQEGPPGGAPYVFAQWSDGGTALARTLAPTSAITLTAAFRTTAKASNAIVAAVDPQPFQCAATASVARRLSLGTTFSKFQPTAQKSGYRAKPQGGNAAPTPRNRLEGVCAAL
jgi:sugar lactone lactonase YvrE